MRRRPLLVAPLALAGCRLFRRRKPPLQPVTLSYVVGAPYRAEGLWRYPRASFDYDQTGLTEGFGAHVPQCTDGAPFDPTALIAAHPTLQLPSVVRVTNLETGRALAVRVDDRGPVSPARLLALTPRAMLLLGSGSTPGVLRVRVQVLQAESRAAVAALSGANGPNLELATAPTGAVQSQSLPPPGIAAQPGEMLRPSAPSRPQADETPAALPLRLPEVVTQGAPQPGLLFIDCGAFGQPSYAHRLAARLAGFGAVANTSYTATGGRSFRVRIGPLDSVAQADATLDQVLRTGVIDARIVVDEV